MAVKAVPDGMERIIAHLIVKGAAEAIEFYKKAFGAEEIVRMSPDGKMIWHAELRIGQSTLFLADEFPGMGNPSPTTLGATTVTLTMYVPSADKAFNQAVVSGGVAIMPLADMFWGDRSGQVRDPFGHVWAIISHVEDVPPEEMAQRSAEAAKKMGC
jgi:PhnB protein